MKSRQITFRTLNYLNTNFAHESKCVQGTPNK